MKFKTFLKAGNIKLILALGFAILFWASAFVAIRSAVQREGNIGYSPGALALLRFLIASVVLLVISVFYGVKLPKKEDLPLIILTGFIGITIYHLFLNIGEINVNAATASFIINTVPVITAIISVIFLRQKVKLIGWLGIIVSLIGVVIISFSGNKFEAFNFGALLILISAISSSIYIILQKKLLEKYTSLELTSYTIWAGTAFLLFFIPKLWQEIPHSTLNANLDVIYLGVFPAAISYLLWTYAVNQFKTATQVASFLYFSPILTTIIGYIWIKESPGFYCLIGGLIILSGVILINTRGIINRLNS